MEDISGLLNTDSPCVRNESSSRFMKRSSLSFQRSASALDETVAPTPDAIFRTSKTPKLVSHLLSGLESRQKNSTSLSGTSHIANGSFLSSHIDVGSFDATSHSSKGKLPVPNLFKTPDQTFLDPHIGFNSTVDEDTNITGILLDDDPGLQAASSLYPSFLRKFQQYPSENEIFELVHAYEDLCSELVVHFSNIIKRVSRAQSKFERLAQLSNHLEQEKSIWRLVRALYQDRLQPDDMDPDGMLLDLVGKKVSDKQLIEHLFEANASIRQCQLVIDWLEKNAAESFQNDCSKKMEFYSDSSVAWENTLHLLTAQKSGSFSYVDRPLVNEMDPDAPVRQDCQLPDLDRDDEMTLLKCMCMFLRTGQLDEAQKLSEKYGQPWMAAALDGWRLYHDPNYESVSHDGMTLQQTEGNPYRDIWKSVCWRLADEAKLSVHERALYAILTGNLKHILPICKSWEDCLWAYLRVVVDIRTEQEIRQSTQQSRAMHDLPAAYWDKMLNLEQVFQEIQALPNEDIRKQAAMHLHVIQKYLILDNIDGLIEEMYEWMRPRNLPSPHLVRLVAHLVLFLRTIGRSTKEELCVSILEVYVKLLIEQKHTTLVAAYTVTLPQGRQVLWYATFLEGITDQQEQQTCLELAEQAGLDVPLITRTVVENIRTRQSEGSDYSSTLTAKTTEEDKQKIDAIGWLVFDPSQRAEAIKQANALMRYFIAIKKLDAAREVFRKVPSDSIDVIKRQWRRQTGSIELSGQDENATREYLCFLAYLQAHDAFNDWFEHFHHAKPEKPERPTGPDVKFSDVITYEHQEKQYQAEVDRWMQSLRAQTKNTTNAVYNVLLFPDGGWLVDQRPDSLPDDTRQCQMSLLRKLCIPQMCFLLHTVLHQTGQHQECFQLADAVASEKNQLYLQFSRQELRDFLAKLRESSLALLDRNLDSLGYPGD